MLTLDVQSEKVLYFRGRYSPQNSEESILLGFGYSEEFQNYYVFTPDFGGLASLDNVESIWNNLLQDTIICHIGLVSKLSGMQCRLILNNDLMLNVEVLIDDEDVAVVDRFNRHEFVELVPSNGGKYQFWNLFSVELNQISNSSGSSSLLGQLVTMPNSKYSHALVIAMNDSLLFATPFQFTSQNLIISNYSTPPELKLLKFLIDNFDIDDPFESLKLGLGNFRTEIASRLWSLWQSQIFSEVVNYQIMISEIIVDVIGIENLIENLNQLIIIDGPGSDDVCDNWILNSILKCENKFAETITDETKIQISDDGKRTLLMPDFNIIAGNGMNPFQKFLGT